MPRADVRRAAPRWIPVATCLLLLGVAPGGHALQVPLDQAIFLITRGGEVIGREELVIRRASGAAPGFVVTSTASYPADRPARVVSAMLQLRPDSQVTGARFELGDGSREVVLVEVGPRRVTVRIGAPGRESTREYPAASRQMLAEDSLFGTYAILPGMGEGAVQILAPRAGWRASGTLTVHGLEPTTVDGTRRTLHHLSLRTRDAQWHLWYDEHGRLIKVALPARDLAAVRTALSPR